MAVKSETTVKKKRGPGKPFVKKDPRINLKGAPKRGTSMAEAYDWVLGMSPDAIADVLEINGKSDLSRQFRQMPRGVQNQILLAMRVFAAAMFEPQASMLNHIVDRVDGPVEEKHKVTGDIVFRVIRDERIPDKT